MILGIGNDLVRVDRFESWCQKDLAKAVRFFGPQEAMECRTKAEPAASLAARFAAREALGKALGTGLAGLRLADIRISAAESNRAPGMILVGTARKAYDDVLKDHGCQVGRIHLSMSHEGAYAQAFVLVEGMFNKETHDV